MKTKRWGYALVGVIVLLFAGLVYAWSVLANPIGAYFTEWTGAQLSFTFTLCMMFFCLGGLISGMLSPKVPAKVMMKFSAVFFLAGFLLASQADSLWMLYIGYGVIAGLASGFSYNSVLGNVAKWFPDAPGLISGVLLMGFGFGSFFIGKIYQAFTPAGEGVEQFRTSFIVMGIVLFIVIFLCSFIIRKPKEEELAEFTKELPGNDKNDEKEVQYAPKEMLKQSSFWIFFLWATLLSAAGLAVVSQASGVAKEVSPSLSAGTISTLVGSISIANGVGRVILGRLYDKYGRLKTMLTDNIIFFAAIATVLMALNTKNFVLIVVGFILTGFAYGGVTPTNSAFVNDYYGSTYYPVNLSLINMNLLIASFGSTIAGALYDKTGSYMSTFFTLIAVLVVGVVAAISIRKRNV